jgi:hypothetical protein
MYTEIADPSRYFNNQLEHDSPNSPKEHVGVDVQAHPTKYATGIVIVLKLKIITGIQR